MLQNHTITKYLVILVIILSTGCHSQSRFPEKYTADREAFTESIKVLRQASDLSQPKKGKDSFEMSKKQEAEYFDLIEKGIELSKKVSDESLNYLHPELKVLYREYLIRGTELYYQGVKSGDIKKQMEGDEKMVKWIRYWESNNKEIAEKAYP